MPFTLLAYSINGLAKSLSSSPNAFKLLLLPNSAPIPLSTPVPVSISIVSARRLIPLTTLSSICLEPSMNPLRLSIKSLRPCPIAPRAPCAMPPTKPPTNLPSPVPIFSRTPIPLSKNTSHCGI